MSKDRENIREHIHTLINRGNQLIRADRCLEATESLSQAQSLASRNSFADEELQALISLSGCAISVGDKVKGASLIESALNIACDLGDGEAQGKCLLNLGGLFIKSNPERAIQYFRDAFTAFESVGNHLGMAQSLDNIGIVYNKLGVLRSAVHYMDRAHKAFEKADEPGELALCLQNIGNLLTDMANQGLEEPTTIRPVAREHYKKALRIFEEIESRVKAAGCLDAMGLLERDEGNLDYAITLHKRAAEIFQRFGFLNLRSSALLHLGSAHFHRGDYGFSNPG